MSAEDERMIRVAVVEDDDACAERICGYLEKFAGENGLSMPAVRFTNGVDFLSDGIGRCDVVLLDIEMPLMDGMTTAKKLREAGDRSPVIFITNMARYAVRGYEVDAVGFIVKPVGYYSFSERLKRAVSLVNAARNNYVVFTLKDGVVKIYLDEVKYVEVFRHKILYHTFGGITEVRGTMHETEDLLAGKNFARCNSCWLVNLRHVRSVVGSTVKVADEELTVSRNKRKEFLEKLTVYLAGGGSGV